MTFRDPGPYTLRAKNPDGRTSKAFAFTVVPSGVESERNDSLAAANPLPVGVMVGKLQTANDVDYFKFTVETTRHIRADLTVPPFANYTLTLYDGAGTPLQPVNAGGDGVPERLDWTVTGPGTFYLKVGRYCCEDYDSVNPYTLTFAAPPAPPDTPEPNQTRETAWPITAGTVITSHLATRNDLDYFTFDVMTTRQLSAVLTVPPFHDYRLCLYNGAGIVQRCVNDGGRGEPERLDWTVTAGTYYLLVDRALYDDYDSVNPYTLATSLTP